MNSMSLVGILENMKDRLVRFVLTGLSAVDQKRMLMMIRTHGIGDQNERRRHTEP